MKRRKIFKGILLAIIIITLLIVFYFLAPYVINLIARPYNLHTYKERLAKKEKQQPASYYLSQNGNDNNNGRTKNTAWKNIKKINETEFNPGDSILLEGTQTFQGNIVFDEYDLGTSKKPIFIGSYGNGKAIVDAGGGTGIQALNSEGFHISNLIVKGNGADKNEGSGVALINNLRGDIKLDFIQIDAVDAFGFGWWGILVDGNRKKSGFRNITIEYCNVYSNGDAGLYIYGEYNLFSKTYAHENVYIRNVKAYNNQGRPDSYENTGSGIVLSDTDNGLIEKCVAYNNGALCHSTLGGPVGIWAWDSRNVIIQYNESFHNKTGATKDGGGFDLDGGMVNSIMQYNYSHDNDGPGYLLAQFSYARDHKENIVRYNISENDCRKNQYGAIHVWGNVTQASVYNNTIFQNKPILSYAVAIRNNEDIRIKKQFPEHLNFSNNIFQTTGISPILIITKTDTSYYFINNNYFTSDKPLEIAWANKTFTSLPQWRNETGQEKQQSADMGFNADPQFLNAGTGIIFSNPDSLITLNAYLLKESSSLINKGIKIPAMFNVPTAMTDFKNKKVPVENIPELGACEYIPNKL